MQKTLYTKISISFHDIFPLKCLFSVVFIEEDSSLRYVFNMKERET